MYPILGSKIVEGSRWVATDISRAACEMAVANTTANGLTSTVSTFHVEPTEAATSHREAVALFLRDPAAFSRQVLEVSSGPLAAVCRGAAFARCQTCFPLPQALSLQGGGLASPACNGGCAMPVVECAVGPAAPCAAISPLRPALLRFFRGMQLRNEVKCSFYSIVGNHI